MRLFRQFLKAWEGCSRTNTPIWVATVVCLMAATQTENRFTSSPTSPHQIGSNVSDSVTAYAQYAFLTAWRTKTQSKPHNG
jgi:hypothetical protein